MRSARPHYYVSVSSEEHLRRNNVTQRTSRFAGLERVAGDERQHCPVCVQNKARLARIDNFGAYHLVNVPLPLGRFNMQKLARPDITKKLKVSVSMSCYDAVARFTRHRARTQVPGSKCQCSTRSSFQNDQVNLA